MNRPSDFDLGQTLGAMQTALESLVEDMKDVKAGVADWRKVKWMVVGMATAVSALVNVACQALK